MDVFLNLFYFVKSTAEDNISFFLAPLFFLILVPVTLKIIVLGKYGFRKENVEKVNKIDVREIFYLIFQFIFYPLVFLVKNVKESQKLINKIAGIILSLFVLLPAWLVSWIVLVFFTWTIFAFSGIVKVNISTSGSSMLPTVREGSEVSLRRFPGLGLLNFNIKRGDIVVFSNEITEEENKKRNKQSATYIKRAVGLPGDIITIKDGFVLVNNKILNEPYILKPRSTFGGKEIKECQEVRIPDGKVLVMGDNRKRSLDSRDIGPVSIKDIQFFLPFNEQGKFRPLWRDASSDKNFANTSFLDVNRYIEIINSKRKENNLKPLKFDQKLVDSAEKRAVAMLKYNDFSSDAKKSNYTMKDALKDAGYKNIVYGELPILGYYDAQELVDYIFEFQQTKDFILNDEYEDIGVSTFVGELNGCPVQIVLQHLGGYIPPDYKKEEIDAWKSILSRLKQIQSGWQSLQNNSGFYVRNKNDIDRINEIIAIRIENIGKIVEKMDANEWLADEQVEYTYKDEELNKEQEAVATKINNL